ncbi:MAG: pyrimidine-nucleoside phosphorylase [Cellvibrionaceae bacterium]|jgi:pyrimidine-nucleoside phosphorylase
MNILEIISKKRDKHELTTDEIRFFIKGYTAGTIADYQASALLMAIYINGMNRRETVDLTIAMTHSGEMLDLHDTLDFIVDKHSSGGVGDKTSLVVLPLVAACGVPVAKMSGRGLGYSGGTLDKMESIRGWTPNLTIEQIKAQAADIGLVLAGQTASLAPADGKLYALRDVTGTVGCMPLIAGSIMSKKLAAGGDAIVLDVKVGSGAFIKTVEEGRVLAELMVNIGKDAGRKMVAVLSDMNQPLGHAAGNGLETLEAINTLRNDPATPADFWSHCLKIGSHMLFLAGAAETPELGEAMLTEARDSGRGLAKFRQMVIAQNGAGDIVDEPSKLPKASFIADVVASQAGYIQQIDTEKLGWAVVYLGGGRLQKTDQINPAVGFVMPVKVGDQIESGQLLATVHAADEAGFKQAGQSILESIQIGVEKSNLLPHFYGIVD